MRAFLALGATALLACSSSSSGSPGTSGGGDGGGAHTVTVANFKFDPPEITIRAGESVTWTFVSGTHTVTSGTNCAGDGAFASGAPAAAPATFAHTFDAAGSFDYFCEPHCASGMVGRVIVQ